MNNEEKILTLLEQMNGRLDNLETEVASVKTEVASVKTEVASVKTEVASVKTEVASVKTEVASVKTEVASVKTEVASVKNSVLKFEHEQFPRIQAALDGVVSAIERDKQMDERLRGVEARVEIHGIEIFALKEKTQR